MGVSALKQVKASAGSGKTYRLTRRFLDLLKGCRDPDPVSACAAAKAGGFSWSEILAVTFTNKAATEMKERLVRALKACALGVDPDELSTALPQARARALLEVILRRYHLLNIRTIDSLQVLLLRLFALQFGLNPDFEMVFDEDQRIFEPVFTRFLERLEKAKGRDLLAEAVESMILHGRARGFWVQERLGESLKGLVGHLRADPGPYVTERSLMLERLERGRRDLLRAVKRLLAVMRELNLKPVANFSNFLDKCLATESCSRPPDSEYAAKAGLRDCLLKESKDLVGPRADTAFAEFKTALSEYAYAQAVLGGALELLPCLTMARELARDLDRFQKSHGLEPISCLARDAADLLSPGLAVPEAYCRLGCRLQHLLIDEFQDTSRLQWAALTPLAEECLAKGGSLFYVGDVKQAIYAWRGGDAELFDQVLAQPGLAELAEDPQTEPLPHNWRSRREIVEFNNRFFSKFADQERISELAAEVLAKAPQEAVDDLARSLARQYRDVVQTIPPDRPGLTGGYVRMERLPGGPKDEVARQTLSAMDKVLDRLAARDRLKDTVILVRKHDEAEMLCGHLVSRGLPVITESSLRLDREPAVRQLAALLAFLDRPEDDLAFVELVCGREVFLGAAELDPDQVLDWLAQGNKSPLYAAFRTEFPEVWERFLEPFQRKSGLMLPYDLAVEATAGFRVLKRRPEAELYVKRFLEVVHLAGERGLGSLPAFLDYWREHSGEEKVPLPENLDAVRILTMHKAKGLEFPVVVVPFHNWSKGRDRDFAGADLDGARYLTRLA
ncbi:MAG: UvrD-helicase domain-containing protein, partial [Desulfovibrionaceae bacterium]|nr:UvrD-helicase domain-containing protein [Desulfovibrionaceae bacterium]